MRFPRSDQPVPTGPRRRTRTNVAILRLMADGRRRTSADVAHYLFLDRHNTRTTLERLVADDWLQKLKRQPGRSRRRDVGRPSTVEYRIWPDNIERAERFISEG
jgi:predicted ArsR family transcriptional regulator